MGEILLSGNENRRQTGARYEKLAAEYLEKQGLFILESDTERPPRCAANR